MNGTFADRIFFEFVTLSLEPSSLRLNVLVSSGICQWPSPTLETRADHESGFPLSSNALRSFLSARLPSVRRSINFLSRLKRWVDPVDVRSSRVYSFTTLVAEGSTTGFESPRLRILGNLEGAISPEASPDFGITLMGASVIASLFT